jgi:hypothetical protein
LTDPGFADKGEFEELAIAFKKSTTVLASLLNPVFCISYLKYISFEI